MPGLYDRQEALQLNVPSAITIAGLGGIGSWVAIDAAMSGVSNLYLFDPDVMEEHNRNRLPFCPSSINRPKVEVVRDYIMGIRPDAIVVAIQAKLEDILLDVQISVSTYLVDCTDSPKAQFTIYNACKKAGRRFIRAGYDGTHITVTSVVNGWMKQEEVETYAVAPSWIVPAQMVAAMAVAKMMKYPDQEVSLDIGEIGIPMLQKAKRLTDRCNQENRRIRF